MCDPSSGKGKKKKDEQGTVEVTEREKQVKEAVKVEQSSLEAESEMLPEVADDLSGEMTVVEEEKTELLAFRLLNEEYGVEINRIKEIIKPVEITNVPRTPDFVEGIISLRGVIVPVYNLKKRLKFAAPSEESGVVFDNAKRILVVNFDNELIGIIVDAVTGVIKLSKGSVEPTPPVIKGVDAEYLKGVGRFNDRLLILLDIDRVLKWESEG